MLTMGIGQVVTSAEHAAGLDIEHFVLMFCLTMFTALTEKDIFFLSFFVCNSKDMCSLFRE